MKLDSFIHFTKVDLMPGVPLYVYSVKGEYYSLLIDTGINQMREQITELCKETGNIKNVLITHAHADHIGCNQAVKNLTNAQFFAAGYLSWIEDLKIHYKEFCIPSEYLPDSPEQRNEILGLMDGPVHIDVIIKEGTTFRPGNDIELTTIELPGHKIEEVAFLENNSGNLFMGDLLLALAAPFFHGFQTLKGFRKSLDRIEEMIKENKIKRILAAHHPPLDQESSIEAINDTRSFLNEVEECSVEMAKGVDFPTLWKNVCSKLNKQLEFRGFAMLQVLVNELIKEGKFYKENNMIFRK
jgi:glyoxylase-like metal-dependent hydrolase (beta-lactamase superfamily II)